MSRQPEPPLTDQEIFDAYQVAAMEVASVCSDQERSHERLTKLGNYMLLCAIGTPESGVEAYNFVFQGGLLLAGMTPDGISTLHTAARRSDVVRYVYSLSYVRDEPVPGIVRRSKSVTLNETAFVRGVLAAKKAA